MAKNLTPEIKAPDGSRYRLVLLRVLDTYKDRPTVGGMEVPAEMLFIDDDDVCELADGDRFVTAYVPIKVFGYPSKEKSA